MFYLYVRVSNACWTCEAEAEASYVAGSLPLRLLMASSLVPHSHTLRCESLCLVLALPIDHRRPHECDGCPIPISNLRWPSVTATAGLACCSYCAQTQARQLAVLTQPTIDAIDDSRRGTVVRASPATFAAREGRAPRAKGAYIERRPHSKASQIQTAEWPRGRGLNVRRVRVRPARRAAALQAAIATRDHGSRRGGRRSCAGPARVRAPGLLSNPRPRRRGASCACRGGLPATP